MKENFISAIVILIMALVICAIYNAVYTPAGSGMAVWTSGSDSAEGTVVVIDAGHGGFDPGKVGVNGALEKDINLTIAYMLKELLEQNGMQVVLTRTDDDGLYEESDSNKKVSDLKRRSAKIKESGAKIVVSIHQNSYTSESISGAQVFYYKGAEESRQIAELIQAELRRVADPDNKREAKSNDSYYLLKNAECPMVIVECGFLSNNREADMLISEEYQKKLAWAIHLGVLQYTNNVQLP